MRHHCERSCRAAALNEPQSTPRAQRSVAWRGSITPRRDGLDFALSLFLSSSLPLFLSSSLPLLLSSSLRSLCALWFLTGNFQPSTTLTRGRVAPGAQQVEALPDRWLQPRPQILGARPASAHFAAAVEPPARAVEGRGRDQSVADYEREVRGLPVAEEVLANPQHDLVARKGLEGTRVEAPSSRIEAAGDDGDEHEPSSRSARSVRLFPCPPPRLPVNLLSRKIPSSLKRGARRRR